MRASLRTYAITTDATRTQHDAKCADVIGTKDMTNGSDIR
jgi:hypothetical protein